MSYDFIHSLFAIPLEQEIMHKLLFAKFCLKQESKYIFFPKIINPNQTKDTILTYLQCLLKILMKNFFEFRYAVR